MPRFKVRKRSVLAVGGSLRNGRERLAHTCLPGSIDRVRSADAAGRRQAISAAQARSCRASERKTLDFATRTGWGTGSGGAHGLEERHDRVVEQVVAVAGHHVAR